MARINDFRTLNLSEKPTPTKKNVGAVSKPVRKTNVNSKKNINQNKSKEKTKPKKNGLGLALFFLVLVLAGTFIGCLFTPVFNITVISIPDGVRVSRDEISGKLDKIKGENILKVNVSALENEIESIPYVRHAKLKRIFPDEIEVHFREREPYAIVKYLESFVLMDKFGYILEIKKENDQEDLAIIYGIESDTYTPGEKLDDIAGLKYENVTYLLETSYQNQFNYTIDEINYTDSENLIMSVKELDIDIIYGSVDKSILAEKMNYLNGILKKLDGKQGKLDISSTNYLEKTIFTERY